MWEPDFGDETYNVCLVVSEHLAEATSGIVYDPLEGRVIWSALAPNQ